MPPLGWLSKVFDYFRTTDETTIIRVFHGSPKNYMILSPGLMYGSRDFGFSAAYAITINNQNKDHGWVYTLDFEFKKIADSTAINAVCDELNIFTVGSLLRLLDEHPIILTKLKKLGYDGLSALDVGFRHHFDKIMVYAVFNAATQVTIKSMVMVTKADIKKTHAPSV